MPVVLDPTYGPKPSLTLLGGSPSSLATPSVQFMPHGRSVTMTGDGLRTVSFYNIYRSQPWIATACRRMSEAIARLPLQLFQYLDDRGDTRDRDRVHAASRLLSRPRPGQRQVHLLWDLALSLYVHGEYVAWKRRPSRGAPPAELWTLDWRLLIPIMAGGRVLAWRWMGEGIPGLAKGETVLIEDTVHVSFAAPGGGELGVSPLEQLGVTIRSEDALQRLAEASARNGTRFGVAVILDPQAKADKVARAGVRDELRDAHGGVDQAFNPAILGGGVLDLKPIGGQTAVEAELLGQRRFNREEAFGVVGLPQPLGGILDDSNYSALRELHRVFYVTSLGGPLAMIAGSFQAQLLDGEAAWDVDDRFYEFNLDEVLKGDAKERWTTYSIGVGFGGLTLNDVRKRENLKPYEDKRAGEPLLKANNIKPLSAIGAGDEGAGQDGVAQAILGMTATHAARAFDRAAHGAGAGRSVLEALDRGRVERELAEDLGLAGLNGSSAAIAGAIASELEQLLADASSVEDVHAAAAAYPLTAGADE